MQSAVEIRHHRKLEALFLQNPQHRHRVRKDSIGLATRIVTEKPGKQRFKTISLCCHATLAGGSPNHLPPPGSFSHVAIRSRSVIRRGKRAEHLPERLADLVLTDPESSLAEMTGVNGRHGLREFEEGVGGVEKDGARRVHSGS